MTVSHVQPFSERSFYAQEFHGRVMGIVVPDEATLHSPALASVVEELEANAGRVILITEAGLDAGHHDSPVVELGTPRFPGKVWRAMQSSRTIRVTGPTMAESAFDVATALGLFKVIYLSSGGGLSDDDGRRLSFADIGELRLRRTEAPAHQAQLLAQIEKLLDAGVPNVNLCTVDGLHEELFSYRGSGTLFTRERYVDVRRLGIEDFDAAADLIERGTSEGYLAPRSDEQLEFLLADGFGAFVGRHLAGIGALRVPSGAQAGEVASLYTLTRFSGGGVGAHLIRFAIDEARRLELDFAYACTTLPRVGAFFGRQGFRPVDQGEIPAEKWSGYEDERRQRVRCYRMDLRPTETPPVWRPPRGS
ncbi:MAG: hypothetical protein K0V04_31030 [Deltaproteobacteria bacterium]|nr:hypothetical protein [Deltaproteobacteria bacterium]